MSSGAHGSQRFGALLDAEQHSPRHEKSRRPTPPIRFDRNPVEIVLVGTLGTGDLPFPSSFRKVNSTPSGTLDMDYAATDREERITIIDVTPGKMTFKLFVWRPPQPEDEIDTMEPVMTYEVKAGNRVPATKTHSSSTQGRSKHGNQTLQRRDQARCARFQT